MDPIPDEAFRVLARPERYRLVTALLEQDTLSIPDNVPVAEDATERNLHIRLHHMHLPKLEKADFIEWDRNANRVSKGPEFDELASFLDLLSEPPEADTHERLLS